MLKNFLSLLTVSSILFVGICTANVSHAYEHGSTVTISKSLDLDCEHCEEVDTQSLACCSSHSADFVQIAVIKSSDLQIVKNFIARPIALQYEALSLSSTLTLNLPTGKAGGSIPKQVALPRLE